MKPIKHITEYTFEELRKLYKSYTLYLFTEHLKRQKTKQNKEVVDELYFDEGYERPKSISMTMEELRIRYDEMMKEYWKAKEENRTPSYMIENSKISVEDLMSSNNMSISILERKLENEDFDNETKKQNILNKISYYNICNEVIYFETGLFDKNLEYSIENEDEETIDYLEERLFEYHMNDEDDIEMGKATKEQIYKFILGTLRFCSVAELKKLLEYADKKFDIAPAHRPRYNKKIYKYDLNGNLIDTFENRAECIEKEGISKPALSQVLSGKRKQHKGFIYKEEDSVN